MTSQELRQKFRDFFEKKYNHKWVESSSLVPDDPTVLLTTAGMQQFKKYFTGELDAEKDFGTRNTVSIQKCFRTSDIDEVGDESHNTFFEMLGNFSFGGYFKKEAIAYAHEFVTRELGLEIEYVTVFGGDPSTSSGQAVPRDTKSEEIWKSLGITDIRKMPREENFWGPTGSEGPCGPTTEIFVKGLKSEVWNLVFNEYYSKEGKLTPLETKGVDTGMGLERLATVVQGQQNIFETDLFAPLIAVLSGEIPIRIRRILADHARAVSFLIADGVRPSNKEAGYVLRRLMRRMIAHGKDINRLFAQVTEVYGDAYSQLNLDVIVSEFRKENEKFQKTINTGLRELNKLGVIDAPTAFKLFETYGLPYEVIKELGGDKASGLSRDDFEKEFSRHQEISRVGAGKKFGKLQQAA